MERRNRLLDEQEASNGTLLGWSTMKISGAEKNHVGMQKVWIHLGVFEKKYRGIHVGLRFRDIHNVYTIIIVIVETC